MKKNIDRRALPTDIEVSPFQQGQQNFQNVLQNKLKYLG